MFTAGNPGSTERSQTVAELESLRDDYLVPSLVYYSELRGILEQFATRGSGAAAHGLCQPGERGEPDKDDQGRLEALQDQTELDRKTADEAALRDWVMNDPRAARYGDPWSAISVAEQKYHGIAVRYRHAGAGLGFESRLFDYARMLVRGEEEREKANGRRLAGVPRFQLAADRADAVLQRPGVTGLRGTDAQLVPHQAAGALGADDPLVKQILGKPRRPRWRGTRWRARASIHRRSAAGCGKTVVHGPDRRSHAEAGGLVDKDARAVRKT